ncbi:wd g-beta repeat-containing protein [Cystoisospora suis]|uniref:Wd g-beta repeat-containing protein n=1 Tax=Cystoisospora suis TaxID=483139 RepID=A0A2C6KI12_9APIC|nr:wd g-beta repeat-containing protein [Cystoisospora suis]
MEGRSNEEGFSSDLHEWMDANSYDTNRPSERDDNEGERRRRRTDGGSGRTRRRGGRRRRSLHFSSNDEMSNDEGMSLRAGEDKISSSLSARQGKERRRRTRRRRFLSSSDSSWPSFHTSDPLTTTPTHSSSSLSLSDPDDSQDDVSSSGGFSQSDEEARERREDPGEDSGDSTYPNNEEAQSSGRDTDGEDEEEIPPGPLRGVGALATADEAEEYLLNANWLPLPENGRFVGHCSAATDIKEVAFWGNDHILAGSDDGSVLVWRASDGSIVNILRGHESHVNCVAVHPSLGGGGGSCCVATSGIDDYIKIWSPTADEPFVMDDNARRILKQIQNLVEEETSSTRTFLTGVGPQVLRHFLGVMNRRRQQGGAPGGDTGEEQQAFCNVQ